MQAVSSYFLHKQTDSNAPRLRLIVSYFKKHIPQPIAQQDKKIS
jgi:hypothetical protein